MPDDSWKSHLQAPILMLQIVHGAMIAASVTFLGIMAGLVFSGKAAPAGTAPLLTYLGLALVIGVLVLRTVASRIVVSRGRRAIAEGRWDERYDDSDKFGPLPEGTKMPESFKETGDAGRLMGVYNSQSILGMALLEGVCFANLVFFVIEQQYLALALAIALLALMAANFPTRAGILTWIEQQLSEVEQQRHLHLPSHVSGKPV